MIVPALGALLAERGIELLLREDLDPVLESLIGDAIGPGTWLDTLRQTVSTYAWDGWADLDPDEAAADPADGVQPGAVRRCLARLLDMAGTRVAGRVIDVGCGAGRTAFDLAARGEDTLVLGVDIHLALLRLARRAAAGVLSYPRRRIGIVYDRRRFPVPLPAPIGWISGPATRSPCPSAPVRPTLPWRSTCWTASSEPRRLLAGLAEVVHTDGRVLLATPYDWSIRATQVETWIGGHSQRAAHEGAAEPFLRALLTEGAHPQSVAGLRVLAEQAAWPWQTRLHDRSAVLYRAHLLALVRPPHRP